MWGIHTLCHTFPEECGASVGDLFYLIGTQFRGYLISRFWRGNISRGFIFAISIGKYEKRALNFAIEAFSTSFYFSKGLNCLKFLDNWNTTKYIFEN